jgi:hypothetical protein
MTWEIPTAFLVGALLGWLIGIRMSRKLRKELEELVTFLR